MLKKLHQDITRNLKISSLNRREFPLFSRNLKIVLKLSITNSCFPRMPKSFESESPIPLYREIFGRSQLGNSQDFILRRIATASTKRYFRISEPQNPPKTFPNFGTPKPTKEVSEFRNPKTHQRSFRISDPQNHQRSFRISDPQTYSKTFPNFETPRQLKDTLEFRNYVQQIKCDKLIYLYSTIQTPDHLLVGQILIPSST